MLIIISPAKTLDFKSDVKFSKTSEIKFPNEATELIKELRKLSIDEIKYFMGISQSLAELNFQRFAQWYFPFTSENSKQALFAFKGHVYTAIDVDSFTQDDLNYAQKSLRILSGLYGLLRPMDLIQPYRLEMGKKLKTTKGKDLYEFWDSKISEELNFTFQEHKHETLVNLASNEYFKSVKTKLLKSNIITPVFKEEKNGKYKVIAIHAKKARGLMTRYIIKNRLTNVDELKVFNENSYYYMDNMSSETELVFVR